MTEQPDRPARIATGFAIARALGTQAGRDLTTEAGYQDGTTITLDSDLGQKLAGLGRDVVKRQQRGDIATQEA